MVSTDRIPDKISLPRSRSNLFAEPQALLLSLLLMFATLAIYYPVHSYPFIDIDDHYYVTENPHVLGPLNLATVKWAFTHPFVLNYDPLTFFSHNLDVQMFQLDAGGHHEVNVVLHALNALLLFWVLKRATGSTGRSFMVAALFALHPINVENVAWISERKTILSTIFFLLALGSYRWYAFRPKLARMAVVALCFGLGLLCKPQVITLPFILLLWDYWPLHRMFAGVRDDVIVATATDSIPPRSFSSLIREKVPLFVIAAIDAVLTMVAQHVVGGQTWPYKFSVRLANSIVAYAQYIGKAFWPTGLAMEYLYRGTTLTFWEVSGALSLLVAITAIVALGWRRRYLLVGWLWFLGTLVPMIGLVVQPDLEALADRYAYTSFIGLFLMLCWGLADWAKQRHLPRFLLPATSVVVLLILSAMVHRQVGFWSNPISLWTHTLEVTHRNWVADVHLGSAYWQEKRRPEALEHFYRAAEERPGDSALYLDIAEVEHERGNLRPAILYYEKALAFSYHDAGDAQILMNMGRAYGELGDASRAQQCYAAAAAYRPPLAPQSAINWRGEWWRDLGPLMWARWREWTSGHSSSPAK